MALGVVSFVFLFFKVPHKCPERFIGALEARLKLPREAP